MSPCAASPGEIRSTLLTLDLVVATQILMQLAVRDIGQVTDIQGSWVPASRRIPRTRKPPPANPGAHACPARQARRSLPSHQKHELWLPCLPAPARQYDASPGTSSG